MSEQKYIIYKATNKLNHKVYIGQTRNGLSRRMRQHLNDAKNERFDCYFHRALRKYGSDGFEWEVIDDSVSSLEELDELERMYIEQYDSFNKNKGYNTTSGGGAGYQLSEEECKKRSERVMGEKNPMYGIPSPNTGKKFTEEHKSKISQALKGRAHPWSTGANNHCARAVINLTTGEIFETVSEASRAYNTNINQLTRHLKREAHANTVKNCIWDYVDNVDIDNIVLVQPDPRMFSDKFVLCTNTKTNETQIYDTISSASHDLHFAAMKISECLSNNVTHHDYSFQYISNDDADIEQVLHVPKQETIRKYIYHIESKQHFKSWADLERTFGYSHKTIRQAYKDNTSTSYGDHFIIYETTNDKGYIQQDENHQWNINKTNSQPIVCPALNMLFESLDDAAEFFEYSSRHIILVCRSHKPMLRNGLTISYFESGMSNGYSPRPVRIECYDEKGNLVNTYHSFEDVCVNSRLCIKQIRESDKSKALAPDGKRYSIYKMKLRDME